MDPPIDEFHYNTLQSALYWQRRQIADIQKVLHIQSQQRDWMAYSVDVYFWNVGFTPLPPPFQPAEPPTHNVHDDDDSDEDADEEANRASSS